jgi:hypothetical protein
MPASTRRSSISAALPRTAASRRTGRQLEAYFDRPVTTRCGGRYAAMKCASLLRETMWSMVSEIHSKVDFDFAPTRRRISRRFEAAYAAFAEDGGACPTCRPKPAPSSSAAASSALGRLSPGKLGWTDTLLLERGKLTSGTTWHAAGLVGQLRTSANITQLLGYSVALYDRLEEETGLQTGWKMNGGLRLACNAGPLDRGEAAGDHRPSFGLEMHLLTPKEAQELWP